MGALWAPSCNSQFYSQLVSNKFDMAGNSFHMNICMHNSHLVADMNFVRHKPRVYGMLHILRMWMAPDNVRIVGDKNKTEWFVVASIYEENAIRPYVYDCDSIWVLTRIYILTVIIIFCSDDKSLMQKLCHKMYMGLRRVFSCAVDCWCV